MKKLWDICVRVGAPMMLNHNDLMERPNFQVFVKSEARSRTDLPPIYLDSGAFQGRTDLDVYCDTLDAFEGVVEWYANLDVIGDPDASEENYRELRRRGYNPIWVAQPGVSDARICKHSKESLLIGIGGLVGAEPAEQVRRIRHVCEIAGAHDTQVHAFGVTSPSVLIRLADVPELASVDASTWLNGYRFGKALTESGEQIPFAERGLSHFDDAHITEANARQCMAWVRGDTDL
jgi:hypothetical protein